MKNEIYELAEIQVSYRNKNDNPVKITSSQDAYKLFYSNWNLDTLELQEEFKVLLLNRANKVLGVYCMSRGGSSGTVVDAKLLFSVILKCNASAVILCHNHPSGNLKPSKADEDITTRIKEIAKLLDISLLDHIIISRNGYYSFTDERGL
ncbi:MAG: JAB domain-containing protein [Flavobacterium sp.]|jgi:DNA repair protein RadC